MRTSHTPDAVLAPSGAMGRRTFLSRAGALAAGGLTAAALLDGPRAVALEPAAPPQSHRPVTTACGAEAYFVPVAPTPRRPAIAVMRGE
jgi:hypothetical protein